MLLSSLIVGSLTASVTVSVRRAAFLTESVASRKSREHGEDEARDVGEAT
jgi:hypothetical protein